MTRQSPHHSIERWQLGDKWEVTAYEVSRWGRLLLNKSYFCAKSSVVIAIVMKRIWESKMVTPSSSRIIDDVDLALKLLEIAYRVNGAAVEGLADINWHIQKVVGEGKSVCWGGAQTKVKGCKCELTKNIFFHIDILKLCLKKKRNITEFLPDITVFYN